MATRRQPGYRVFARPLQSFRPTLSPGVHHHREDLSCRGVLLLRSYHTDADRALALVLGQLDQLCAKDDADQLMGRLLRQFNAVTGLSGWSDRRQLH